MPSADRGDVWTVDLGMTAKVRPCLVLSIPAEPGERVLTALVPHTTSVRGTRLEVPSAASFLKAGVFDAQQLVTVPQVKLVRRLGRLPADGLQAVEHAVRAWLGLE